MASFSRFFRTGCTLGDLAAGKTVGMNPAAGNHVNKA
jgi:hypothetical protein